MLPTTAFTMLLPCLYLGKKGQPQQDKANIRDKKIICINVCPRVCICTTCVPGTCGGQEDGVQSPGIGVMHDFELPCGS